MQGSVADALKVAQDFVARTRIVQDVYWLVRGDSRRTACKTVHGHTYRPIESDLSKAAGEGRDG